MLVGVALTASDPQRSPASAPIAAVLAAYAGLRMVFPLRWVSRSGAVHLITESVVCYIAVAATGFWSSPFVFCLVTPLVAAGFASGTGFALSLAVITSLAVTLPSLSTTDNAVRRATAGCSELVLGALIADYGRRLFGAAEQRTTTALSRLSDLTEANDLLQGLNALAQRLPASLDLRETVRETMEQTRAILKPDAIAVFLWDPSLSRWTVDAAEGVRLPSHLNEGTLPVPVRLSAARAFVDHQARLVDLAVDGPGMTPAGRVGIYAPLIARQSLVGVLVVESADQTALSERDVRLMTSVAEQAALAIDNAQWFGRLRTVGAEEERSRIARDLHDRVAQTMAYLAFELDRIVDLSTRRPITAELAALRHDVRRVVSEIRDTLYDLRTDVTDDHSMADTLEGFLARVETRSGLRVSFDCRAPARLPLPVERELWRIAQEAITNVEHHAHARQLEVIWDVTDTSAELRVTDNGRGFPEGTPGRMDSYGLLGMRERADAIGATLEIKPAPNGGTVVSCRLETN